MSTPPDPAQAPTAAPTAAYNTTSLQTPEAEAAVTGMRSSLQVDESRNLALCKRERSEATLHLKIARERAYALHVRQVKVNADAHALHLLVVESDMLCKTLGLALSQAETAVTKQQAKVVALAAYERQNLPAEADIITRLFQDLPPSPVPSPVMAGSTIAGESEAPATPVRAGPDSTASASTLCSLPAPAFPAKVLFPAQDPAAPVQTVVPWLTCPPVPTPANAELDDYLRDLVVIPDPVPPAVRARR